MTEFPSEVVTNHDLDPNADGDVTVKERVDRSQAVVIAANSKDGNNWSASVEWQDNDGNVFQTQSKSDIDLSSVSDDHARLYRKGVVASVTFTSEEAGGVQNRINAFLDTHE